MLKTSRRRMSGCHGAQVAASGTAAAKKASFHWVHSPPSSHTAFPHEAVIGRSGFPDDKDDPKHRFVLSHPWLSKEHPDPSGAKLQMLVGQLDLLGALDDDAAGASYCVAPRRG